MQTKHPRHLASAPLNMFVNGCVELDINIQIKDLFFSEESKKSTNKHNVPQKAFWSGKPVVVETMEFSLFSRSYSKDIACFEQETALMLRLGFFSERIVQLYGIVAGHHPRLVKEVMDNGDLVGWVDANRSKPLNWALCIRLAIDIATAVRDTHALGIPHNRVTLPSVLLDSQMRAKLVGPALIPREKELFWRIPEGVPANVIAPPQNSDIYDMGLVLWALVTRRKPYVRVEAGRNKSRWLSQSELEQALQECDCPAGFKQLILDCWSVDLQWPAVEYRKTREYRKTQKQRAVSVTTLSESKTTTDSSLKQPTAANALQVLADQGHPRAQYHFGLLLRDGVGVKKDEIEAERYFFQAAEQGQGEAQQLLGWLNPPRLMPRLSAADVLNRLLLLQNEKESKFESAPLSVVSSFDSSHLLSLAKIAENKVDRQTGRAMLNLAPPGLSLGQKLGAGGFGKVYEARCNADKRVAVKKIKLAKRKDRAKAHLELEREAALLLRAGLVSNYVVRPYGIITDQDFQLVMELMTKGDLAKVLRKHREDNTRMPWLAIYRIARAISRGLRDLHLLGVLHRDLKSHNILLTDEGSAKLADLGLADIIVSDEPRKGTVGWRAPETMQENAIANEASDIYSLGVVLWELATHRKPYTTSGKKTVPLPHEQLMAALDESQSPVEFKQLIRRCLSLDPYQRPTADRAVKYIESIFNAAREQRPETSLAVLLAEKRVPLSQVAESKIEVSTIPLNQQQSLSSTPLNPVALRSFSTVCQARKPCVDEMLFQQAVEGYNKSQYRQVTSDLEQLASAGYPPACLYLTTIYEQGKGVKKNSEQAVFWRDKMEEHSDWFIEGEVESKANHDNAKMLFYRGWYYHLRVASWAQNKTIEGYRQACEDYQQAYTYYQRAWEGGYIAAYVNLGDLYQHVLKEWAEGAEYYRKAAEPGYNHATAQYNLALFCFHCFSQTEAATWFLAAAKQGHVGAQFRFALMCRDKIGVAHKPEWISKWSEWMRCAAEGGHVEAQRLLDLHHGKHDVAGNSRHKQTTSHSGIEASLFQKRNTPPSTSISTSTSSISSPSPPHSFEGGFFVNKPVEKVGGSPNLAPLVERQLRKPTPDDVLDLASSPEDLAENQLEL